MNKKMRVLNLSLVCALATMVIGCNTNVADYVKSTIPSNVVSNPVNNPVTPVSSSPNQMKISPGQFKAQSASASVIATVSATRQVMTSANMSAQVGINRSRSSQQ